MKMNVHHVNSSRFKPRVCSRDVSGVIGDRDSRREEDLPLQDDVECAGKAWLWLGLSSTSAGRRPAAGLATSVGALRSDHQESIALLLVDVTEAGAKMQASRLRMTLTTVVLCQD